MKRSSTCHINMYANEGHFDPNARPYNHWVPIAYYMDTKQNARMEFKREPSTSVQADMISEVNLAVSQHMRVDPGSTLQVKPQQVVVKQEFPEGPPTKKKSKNASLSFDKSGKARLKVGGRWKSLPSDLTQRLQAEMSKAMDEQREETSPHGIAYDELLKEAEKHRGKNLRDLDVGATRKLCTRYRKLLFMSPEDIQGKDKIKFLWSTKPCEWPEGLLHVDPNNARAGAGDAGKKPNKEQLLPMVEYMQRLYEERREFLIGNFHGAETPVKAEIRQNVGPMPAQTPAQNTQPEMDLDKIRRLIETIMKVCPTSCDMMRIVYQEIWGRAGEIAGDDDSSVQVLRQLQDGVVAYLKIILTRYKQLGEVIEFKPLRESLKHICEPKLNFLKMRKQQIVQQGPTVQVKPEPLSPPILPSSQQLPMPIPSPPAQTVSMSPTRNYPSTIDLEDLQSAGLADSAVNSQAMVDHDYYENPLRKLQPPTQMEVPMDHEYSQRAGVPTGPIVTQEDLVNTLSRMSGPMEAVSVPEDQILGSFRVEGLPEDEKQILYAALDAVHELNMDPSNVMMSMSDPMMSQAGYVQQESARQASGSEAMIPTFIDHLGDEMSMDFS